MDERQIADRTRAYIRKTFLYARPDAELPDDERLLEGGIIDSMGVLELIAFLEKEFGITIRDEDITEEHLGSLRSVSRYVASRNGRGVAV